MSAWISARVALRPEVDRDRAPTLSGRRCRGPSAESLCSAASDPESRRLIDQLLGDRALRLASGLFGVVTCRAPFGWLMAWMNFHGSLAIRAPTSALCCARSATVNWPAIHLSARSSCLTDKS